MREEVKDLCEKGGGGERRGKGRKGKNAKGDDRERGEGMAKKKK